MLLLFLNPKKEKGWSVRVGALIFGVGVGYIIKLIDGKKNTFVLGVDQAEDQQVRGGEDALVGSEEQDET